MMAPERDETLSPAPGRGQYDRALTRERRQAEQRERLLLATASAFVQQRPGVSGVIALAGVGRNTFYEYFDDFEHALEAVSTRAQARLELGCRTALERARTPIERLRSISRNWCSALLEVRDEAAVLLCAEQRTPEQPLSPAGRVLAVSYEVRGRWKHAAERKIPRWSRQLQPRRRSSCCERFRHAPTRKRQPRWSPRSRFGCSIEVSRYPAPVGAEYELCRDCGQAGGSDGAPISVFPCGGDGDSVPPHMSGTPVELKIGGQTYRVLASAEEAELKRLAEIVDTRLRSLTTPGRQVSPQTLLLAALALAHDLEEERERRLRVEARAKEMLSSVLERIDAVLESSAAPEHAEEADSAGDEAPLT